MTRSERNDYHSQIRKECTILNLAGDDMRACVANFDTLLDNGNAAPFACATAKKLAMRKAQAASNLKRRAQPESPSAA